MNPEVEVKLMRGVAQEQEIKSRKTQAVNGVREVLWGKSATTNTTNKANV